MVRLTWLMLVRHWVRLACSLALARAGNSIAARMAMMAITTSSSINVNALRWPGLGPIAGGSDALIWLDVIRICLSFLLKAGVGTPFRPGLTHHPKFNTIVV